MLGIISFFYLKDGPASARWLTTAEKLRLNEQLAVQRTLQVRQRLAISRQSPAV